MEQRELELEIREQIAAAQRLTGADREAKVPDFPLDWDAICEFMDANPNDALVLAYKAEDAAVKAEAHLISAAMTRMRRKAARKLDTVYDLFLVSQQPNANFAGR